MAAANLDAASVRTAELRALDAAAPIGGNRILATTLGRAQAAAGLARQRSDANVCCWFLDDYQRQLAQAAWPVETNLALVCQADSPETAADLAVIPVSRRGEAEFTRDVLQAACQRLEVGGTLVAAVDHPRDRWLGAQLGELFAKVAITSSRDATVYLARKRESPRRVRNFSCQFAFRDRLSLVHAVSRPGVFAHRRIDPGARQLINAAEVSPRMRVLDIGCGAGAVSLALAARDPTVAVHAIDSNARAIQCTLEGARLNALAGVTVELNASGTSREDCSFDLALANPPYYSDFRIARLFVDTAHRALRSGGRLILVTKRPAWYEAELAAQWRQVEIRISKAYHIVTAIRP
jgi:16S rRNA (guanine1207-N2)-methyltransferase